MGSIDCYHIFCFYRLSKNLKRILNKPRGLKTEIYKNLHPSIEFVIGFTFIFNCECNVRIFHNCRAFTCCLRVSHHGSIHFTSNKSKIAIFSLAVISTKRACLGTLFMNNSPFFILYFFHLYESYLLSNIMSLELFLRLDLDFTFFYSLSKNILKVICLF